MQKRSRLTGLFLALLGLMALFASLNKPRVEALHGSDIMGLHCCPKQDRVVMSALESEGFGG